MWPFKIKGEKEANWVGQSCSEWSVATSGMLPLFSVEETRLCVCPSRTSRASTCSAENHNNKMKVRPEEKVSHDSFHLSDWRRLRHRLSILLPAPLAVCQLFWWAKDNFPPRCTIKFYSVQFKPHILKTLTMTFKENLFLKMNYLSSIKTFDCYPVKIGLHHGKLFYFLFLFKK